MTRLPNSVVALLLSTVAAACSSDGSPGTDTCTGHVRAAIFNGAPGSSDLDPAPAERAALGSVEGPRPGDFCTATLVRPTWALTASHCNFTGDLVFRSSDVTLPPMAIDAREVHPILDVLVVHLNVPPAARPVPVRAEMLDESWLGRAVTLAGVGATETGSSGALLFATEPIVGLTSDEVAVDGNGDSGACGGDSGGPLLIRGSDARLQVLGTLRRGEASCLGVDYYVRADRFSTWIDDVAGPEREATEGCE